MANADEYDWIDDAFNETKQDPLEMKGMTGCSSLSVLIAAIGIIAVLELLAFVAVVFAGLAD